MMSRKVRFGMVVALVFGLAGLVGAQDKPKVENKAGEQVRAKAPDKATAALLEKRVPEINFNGQGLADVIDFLRDVSGANIFVDWKALEAKEVIRDAPVRARLRDVTLATALTKILESASTEKAPLKWEADQGVITVTTGDGDKKVKVIGQLPPAVDRRLPEVNFQGQALSDVVDFLRDVSGANIFVNWNSLKAAGIDVNAPVSARLKDVTLSTALKHVLESVSDGRTPLRIVYERNVLTITADRAAQEEKGKGQKK